MISVMCIYVNHVGYVFRAVLIIYFCEYKISLKYYF